VCLFAATALLDAGLVVGSGRRGGVTWCRCTSRARIIDRAFPIDFLERSYSAPLARSEFYGGAPLLHPGRHLLGPTSSGATSFHLTLKGTRVALLIGGLTTLIVIPLALLFGVTAATAAAAGRRGLLPDLDARRMPGLLLLIALINRARPGTRAGLRRARDHGLGGALRLVRGETLKLRELDYVMAARALGVSEARIVFRHLLPNLMHLVVITFVLLFSGLVLSEALLSWLGIGIDGSWGR